MINTSNMSGAWCVGCGAWSVARCAWGAGRGIYIYIYTHTIIVIISIINTIVVFHLSHGGVWGLGCEAWCVGRRGVRRGPWVVGRAVRWRGLACRAGARACLCGASIRSRRPSAWKDCAVWECVRAHSPLAAA